MTARDFCYWLQGFFELSPAVGELSQQQTEQIRNHLHMVFAHEIDPAMGNAEHQKKLTEIHNPPKPLTEEDKQRLKDMTDKFEQLRRQGFDFHMGPKINC